MTSWGYYLLVTNWSRFGDRTRDIHLFLFVHIVVIFGEKKNNCALLWNCGFFVVTRRLEVTFNRKAQSSIFCLVAGYIRLVLCFFFFHRYVSVICQKKSLVYNKVTIDKYVKHNLKDGMK